MKNLVIGSLVATSLTGTAFAAFSLPNFDGNINPVIHVDGKVSYDDNLQQQPAGPQKIHDTIYELSPGLSVSNAKGAAVQANLDVTGNFTRYADHNVLRTNLAVFDYTSSYTDAKNSADLNAGYHQLNQDTPTGGTAGLLRSNETVANGGDVYQINQNLKVGFDAKYDYTKYLTPGLANSKIYTVPLTAYWALNPKLDATVGAQYAKTDLTAGQTPYTDYYYSVGLKGELFNPKLTGNVSVGLNEHRGSVTPLSDGNSSSVGVQSNIQWAESATDTFTFGLSNQFGAASSGQEQQTLALTGGLQHKLSEQLLASVNLGYSIINYSGPRVDDYWSSTFALRYNLSATWAAAISYKYQNNADRKSVV